MAPPCSIGICKVSITPRPKIFHLGTYTLKLSGGVLIDGSGIWFSLCHNITDFQGSQGEHRDATRGSLSFNQFAQRDLNTVLIEFNNFKHSEAAPI